MSARRVQIALVVVALLLLLAPALFAQEGSHARIVRLSYIDGTVTIDRNDGQGPEKAILNMPIIQGVRLTAEEDSRLEVEFENGSTLRLVGPGEVAFRELSLQGSGDKVSYVDVKSGLAYFNVNLKNDDDFRVAFDSHNFALKKSSRFRVNVDLDVQRVAVFKGELELQGVPDEVKVKKNETLSFDSTDSQRYFLAKDIDSLGPDAWDKQRDEDRDTLARSQDYKQAMSYYGGPYSYGTWDLARYGNFFYSPGYGWLWQPFGWGFNSDPFSNGAWSYYPSVGWVFVSYYPWGWTPYRYGGWAFVPGYGWCWRPGGYGSGWYSAPVVYNPPASYTPPQQPTGGPGPTRFVGGRRWPDINPKTGEPTDRGDRFRRMPAYAGDHAPARTPAGQPAPTGAATGTTTNESTTAPTTKPGSVWDRQTRPGATPATNMKPQMPPQNLPPQSAPAPRRMTPPPRQMRSAPDTDMRPSPSAAPAPAPRTQAPSRAPAPAPSMQRAPAPTPQMAPPPSMRTMPAPPSGGGKSQRPH
jgi:hypothetical protein